MTFTAWVLNGAEFEHSVNHIFGVIGHHCWGPRGRPAQGYKGGVQNEVRACAMGPRSGGCAGHRRHGPGPFRRGDAERGLRGAHQSRSITQTGTRRSTEPR
ncbi:hypothetical protein NOVOSPHI9U_70042 [Novosphingobium sp. 9U]|nr:hypothetical protein NOVOSPHI9U_70042 [Novosphingobium sp. 9U]